MTPELKKRLRILAALLGAIFLVAVTGWVFAPAVLAVDSGARSVDAVVVLGGEPQTRPTRAAEVYHEIVAGAPRTSTINSQPSTINSPIPVVSGPLSRGPFVIVSGNGDCQDVRRQMEAKGVPQAVIETECESRSTRENALLSAKLLREHKATNVVLVTSWYHSRRALACFQTAAPEIHFYARPTICPPAGLRHPDSYIVKRVFQEYAKIVYYWLVHGIPPWR